MDILTAVVCDGQKPFIEAITYLISGVSVIVIPRHAARQLEKRGISGDDVSEAVEHGEVIIEEANHRFGLKKFSKMEGLSGSLIVIWRHGRNDDKVVVTAYWRR
ncbi:DUF4258 domain-containing protein [Candidatus Micrarchaeota archaeon]|nr:DUF4258 domain-containing protein [Candidatus Micrarchaeota archaeon]